MGKSGPICYISNTDNRNCDNLSVAIHSQLLTSTWIRERLATGWMRVSIVGSSADNETILIILV